MNIAAVDIALYGIKEAEQWSPLQNKTFKCTTFQEPCYK